MQRDNIIKIGKIVDEGIEKMVVVELDHPKKWNYRVYANPTKKGKETKAYRETRHQLGDDWYSDITQSWYESHALSEKMQIKISKVIDKLRAEGYTRY